MRWIRNVLATLAVVVLAGTATAADAITGMSMGSVELKTAGPLAFGPDNVLFVGDASAATIYAINTGDKPAGDAKAAFQLDGVTTKLSELLGVEAGQVTIADMKVNPKTGNIYLSVGRGKGANASAVLARIDRTGKLEVVVLKDIMHSKCELANPAKNRNLAITGLAFVKDTLYVSGLSNEEFASTFRVIPFPFKDSVRGAGVEIYHASHGKFETASPIRTFTPFDIAGQAHLLAAYTCTPLVKIPVSDLKPGSKVRGTTVAELGNRNTPLDMVPYEKDGRIFVLMANTARGVMKVSTDNVDKIEGLVARVAGTAGLKFETIESLKGVVQLDRLNDTMALMLIKDGTSFNLKSVEFP